MLEKSKPLAVYIEEQMDSYVYPQVLSRHMSTDLFYFAGIDTTLTEDHGALEEVDDEIDNALDDHL